MTEQSDERPAGDREPVPEHLQTLATVLDDAVRLPGTDYRIGLDPVVGLLPVVGDVPTTVASTYLVVEAARRGVPQATLVRMVANLALDAVIGSIPVVGDVFDAAWKANARNLALMEGRLANPNESRADRRLVLLAGVGVFAALLGLSWLVYWLLLTAAGVIA